MNRSVFTATVIGGLLVPALACGQIASTAAQGVCRVVKSGMSLPETVRETSGVAQSRATAGLFWTHNDSGGSPELFAFDSTGVIRQVVRIHNAKISDWEDIEAGPCDGGSCLYIADIGNNSRNRQSVMVYRVPEPAPGSTAAQATAIELKYPDHPQDAEALFVMPTGDVYVVTKGRHATIALYRMPANATGSVTLSKVRELLPQPKDELDRVTSATASPNGRWVGIRTYRTLYLYPAADLVAGNAVKPHIVDLRPLREIQGEALAIADDGRVWFTSEAENMKDLPGWSQMQCALD